MKEIRPYKKVDKIFEPKLADTRERDRVSYVLYGTLLCFGWIFPSHYYGLLKVLPLVQGYLIKGGVVALGGTLGAKTVKSILSYIDKKEEVTKEEKCILKNLKEVCLVKVNDEER